jgi:hypothetical protein
LYKSFPVSLYVSIVVDGVAIEELVLVWLSDFVEVSFCSSLVEDDCFAEGSIFSSFLFAPQDAKTKIVRITENIIKNFFILTSLTHPI